jgi:hypothetical protein
MPAGEIQLILRLTKNQRQIIAVGGNTLAAVEVSARETSSGTSSALAVVLRGGRRTEVGRGFDTGALEQLVKQLVRVSPLSFALYYTSKKSATLRLWPVSRIAILSKLSIAARCPIGSPTVSTFTAFLAGVAHQPGSPTGFTNRVPSRAWAVSASFAHQAQSAAPGTLSTLTGRRRLP